MTALEQLGSHFAESRQPPDVLRELVVLHLIDTVGAWIASTRTAEGANLLRFRATLRARRQAGEALALELATRCAQPTADALALALTIAAPTVGHHNAATTSRWFALGQCRPQRAHHGGGSAARLHLGSQTDRGSIPPGRLRHCA